MKKIQDLIGRLLRFSKCGEQLVTALQLDPAFQVATVWTNGKAFRKYTGQDKAPHMRKVGWFRRTALLIDENELPDTSVIQTYRTVLTDDFNQSEDNIDSIRDFIATNSQRDAGTGTEVEIMVVMRTVKKEGNME